MAIDYGIFRDKPQVLVQGGFEGGMKARELFEAKQKQNAINDAYKNNFNVGPDGKGTLNQQGVLQQLTQAGYGKDAYELNNQFTQQQAEQKKAQYEKMKNDLQMSAQLLGSAEDQFSWDNSLATAKKFGLDVSGLPQQYDPRIVDQLNQQVLDAQKRFDNEMKSNQFGLDKDKFGYQQEKDQIDFGLKRDEFEFKKKMDMQTAQREWAKLRADKTEKANEGQKTVDKEFAKDYNDWTSGGGARARSEIAKIDAVIKRLQDGKGTTGGLTGIFGDNSFGNRFTSNDVLKNRAAAQQSAMTLVKQLLSGATSDKDREQIVNTLWNEADSTENNIARLQEFSDNMKARANETDAKAQHFQSTNGSLKGFKYNPSVNKNNKTQSGQVLKTSEIEWAE